MSVDKIMGGNSDTETERRCYYKNKKRLTS